MIRFFIFIALLTITPFSAHAQDNGPNASSETRIEVDEENHVIRFFIKGEEAARLSESGFEVRENIAYGGVLMDQGTQTFLNGVSREPVENKNVNETTDSADGE